MNKEEKLFKCFKYFLVVLFPIPLLMGTIGYYMSGQTLADSIYYSISLYAFNWDSIANNVWIEIARWMAPIVTATGLITIIKKAYEFLHDKMICFMCKDATAIYSNIEAGRILKETIPHSILSEEMELKKVKNHIILFENDKDNLIFYQKNKNYFENKNNTKSVYLCLNDINLNALKTDMGNVRIFKAGDVIARKLWKQIRMWQRRNEKSTFKIVIAGFSGLGQSVLNYGLQVNLFSGKQSIEYHVIGESEVYQASHKNLKTMNCDKIVFHGKDESVWEVSTNADYIILTDEVSYEWIEGMHYAFENAQIYYYSPETENITDYIKLDNVFSFGENEIIYTDENIRTNKLYKLAMQENYNYILNNVNTNDFFSSMEEEWDKLDGFTKGSNISSSDYGVVIQEICGLEKLAKDLIEELAELEHIRWGRYHLINHWIYGIPKSGKNKDSEKRIHRCLCPYSELSEDDKEKDRQVIIGWCNSVF